MTESSIKLHIAEHGLVTTVETMIAGPEKLGITEADAAARLRIIAHVLTLPEGAINTIAWSAEALEALNVGSRST